MKYDITTIRRQSRNCGVNFCRYYVIYNTETKEIVYDNDAKVGMKNNWREQSLKITCDKLNSGELKTQICTNKKGDKSEEIVW